MKRYIKPAAGILIALAAAAAFSRFELAAYFEPEKISSLVRSMGAYGPAVFICLCIAGVFLHLPEFVLIAIGGVVFGAVEGFFYGWAGALAGSTATFLCARYFLRDSVRGSLTARFKRLEGLDRRIAARGFQTVLVLRLVLFMAPPLNWLIAVTGIRFPQYVAASALGIIPGVAVTCYCAGAIARARSLADVLTAEFIIPLSILGALVLASSLAARRLLAAKEA